MSINIPIVTKKKKDTMPLNVIIGKEFQEENSLS